MSLEIRFADVDGDGDVDVLAASSGLYWYKNDGSGSFEKIFVSDVGPGTGSVYSVYAADVDGDGDMDVLSA